MTATLIIDLGTQVSLLILGYLQLVTETLNLDLQELSGANLFTSVRREVVLVMGLGTVYDTETFIQIFYGLAGHARSNLRTVARLAIQIAREALLSDLIRIVTEGAVVNTVGCIPLFLLEDYDIGHVVGCIRWAIGITLTICKER